MTIDRLGLSFLLVFVFMGICAQETISLAGTWQFQLDSLNRGVPDKWFTQNLADQIMLPGTTDEGRKGRENKKVWIIDQG